MSVSHYQRVNPMKIEKKHHVLMGFPMVFQSQTADVLPVPRYVGGTINLERTIGVIQATVQIRMERAFVHVEIPK